MQVQREAFIVMTRDSGDKMTVNIRHIGYYQSLPLGSSHLYSDKARAYITIGTGGPTLVQETMDEITDLINREYLELE